MRLTRRLDKLEKAAGVERRGLPCGACGHGAGVIPAIVAYTAGDREDEPERCPACGRQLLFKIEFDTAG